MINGLFFFTKDLRTHDNLALATAVEQANNLHVAYILDPTNNFGGASKWFLHYRLKHLADELKEENLSLHLYSGKTEDIVNKLCTSLNINKIYYNRQYDNVGRRFGSAIKAGNVEALSFNSQLLIEPAHINNKQGTPFKVYTPFSKTVMAQTLRDVKTYPSNIPPVMIKNEKSLALKDLHLAPKIHWDKGFFEHWNFSESGITNQWFTFLKEDAKNYALNRDFMALDATSKLSGALAFGCLSVTSMAHDIHVVEKTQNDDLTPLYKQLVWRDFSYYQLYHFPALQSENWNEKFRNFQWDDLSNSRKKEQLKKWQTGQTGIPIIDAGMRELWHTGYMHNRVRMIVASFLVKNLLIHWTEGEKWFWDTLVDADPANNSASWQWVAGSGADAAPYFRIFNPITQSEKFDKHGEYIRKWVPELEKLDDKNIHAPHLATGFDLQLAGITIGKTYPAPLVDLKATREEALSRYQHVKTA